MPAMLEQIAEKATTARAGRGDVPVLVKVLQERTGRLILVELLWLSHRRENMLSSSIGTLHRLKIKIIRSQTKYRAFINKHTYTHFR
jgi:hypothetical protein